MNRVSMSMRAFRPFAAGAAPGPIGTRRSVNTPATWGRLSTLSVPAAPGMPTKSAPTEPTFAHRCSALQAPASTAARGATAATVSRKAT